MHKLSLYVWSIIYAEEYLVTQSNFEVKAKEGLDYDWHTCCALQKAKQKKKKKEKKVCW